MKSPDEEEYVNITLEIMDDDVVIVRSVDRVHEHYLEGVSAPVVSTELCPLDQVMKNSPTRDEDYNCKKKDLSLYRKTTPHIREVLKGLRFITTEFEDYEYGWYLVENRFDQLTTSTNGLLHHTMFGKCLGMDQNSQGFAEELFRALATKHHTVTGDSIDKAQLRKFWDHIADGDFDSRLQIFFDLVDRDADGRITEDEVREIIILSASANRLSNIQKQAHEYAALIMEGLDPSNVGYILIGDLEDLLLEVPNQSFRVGDSRLLSELLSQTLRPAAVKPIKRMYRKMKYFLMDNWKRVWIMVLWLGIMGGLFIYKFVQYRKKAAFDVMGYCICVSKAGAETLKFNMALVLLPVCHNTITWFRNNTKLRLVLPLDDSLNFHKVIGIGIGIGTLLHGLADMACDFPRVVRATKEEYEPMKPFFGEEQPSDYWWFLKGVEAVTGIIMVLLMVVAFTLAHSSFRNNKLNLPKFLKKLTGFNAFWYSHHLLVIVYALLIAHGTNLYLTKEWYQKTIWMYLTFPVILYGGERLIRYFRSSIKPVQLLKVALHPGNVLALDMAKPRGFEYKSGQYVLLNCASISPLEWHPFFLTSAPGDDDISVHIRTLGDWTMELRTVFTEACGPSSAETSSPTIPKILVDGPYGAPTQDYKNYEVVLLIGLGIGATPMISIVNDILHNIRMQDSTASATPNNNNKNERKNKRGSSSFKTRKAYFYWVTREQGSFQWFKEIMNEVAELDENKVIKLHTYCTSVYEEGDARSAVIAMLQSLHHAKNGVDVVSGTHVKSHFGKPDWRQVYKKIALKHPDSRIGLYFCGPSVLRRELKKMALNFSHKISTKFDFHTVDFIK